MYDIVDKVLSTLMGLLLALAFVMFIGVVLYLPSPEEKCLALKEANNAVKHTLVYPNCVLKYSDGSTETIYISSGG